MSDLNQKRQSRIEIMTVVFCLILVNQAWAQYKISKFSINNGGGTSINPDYQVSGSIGQKEASNSSSGNNFRVTGGFWSARNNDDLIFKNGFE